MTGTFSLLINICRIFRCLICKVTSCGMSDTIGPVHLKDRPGSEMQSRIDAEVCLRTYRSMVICSLAV